jgi:hypothetical protein
MADMDNSRKTLGSEEPPNSEVMDTMKRLEARIEGLFKEINSVTSEKNLNINLLK